MKDSLSLKKKVRKFIKRQPSQTWREQSPILIKKKSHSSLREKADKLVKRSKKEEVRGKEKKPSSIRSQHSLFGKIVSLLEAITHKKTKKLSVSRVNDVHGQGGQTRLTGASIKEGRAISAVSKAFRRIDFDLKLLMLPLIFYVILAILNLLTNHVVGQLFIYSLNPQIATGKINPYPFVSTKEMPEITAKAAIITDAYSQVILFSKNQDLRFSMASTTKIMTAIAALDYFKPDDVLAVQSVYGEGTVLGLLKGEKFSFHDLLYAMLLPSANDAAEVIAENYPGGVSAFVKKMNEKARALHLADTHFSDPTGLDDDEDFTTVVDMARLSSYAITDPLFAQVINTKEKVITDLNYGKSYDLSNLNKLLGIDGVNGIKTGTTEGAGEVLVTSTTQNGHTYIIVVMNSMDRFVDTRRLLAFIADNVHYVLPPAFLHTY